MKKLILVHFFFIQLLPFLLLANSFTQLLPLLLVWLSFLLGLLLPNYNKHKIKSSLFSIIYVKKYILIILFLCYFLFKSEYILETFQAIVHGEYMKLALSRTIERYSGHQVVSIWTNFSTIAYFLISYSIGTMIGTENKIKYYIYFFLFITFIELSSFAKLSVLFGGILLIFSYTYNHRSFLQNQSYSRIFFTYFFALSIGLSLLFLISYGRVYNEEDPVHIVLYEKMGLYTVAMYQAFFIWFEDYHALEYGKNTFSFLWKVLGYHFPQGFYFGVQTQFGFTNIYTYYRNLFADFPTYMVSLIMFSMGYFIRTLDYKKHHPVLFIFGLLSFLMVFFTLYSPFIFTTVALALVFIILISSFRYKHFDTKDKYSI